jgi:hypothetical protein
MHDGTRFFMVSGFSSHGPGLHAVLATIQQELFGIAQLFSGRLREELRVLMSCPVAR